MSAIFKYNGFEAEYDFADYEQVKKWETALEAYEARRKSLPANKTAKGSEIMRNLVLAVADFFDSVFGEGAANSILGKTTNVNAALDAFRAAQKFCIDGANENAKQWNSAAAEFTPKNRAQRRAIERVK